VIAEILSVFLGVSAPVAAVAMLMAAIRRMLRHSISLWGVRSPAEGDCKFEYRFAIQNLEPVPVDDSLFITITEEWAGVPKDAPRTCGERIRVYSGHTRPEFLGTVSEEGVTPPKYVTSLRFPRMPPHDTWTLKIRSNAKSVALLLKPRNIDVGRLNPFRPWVAVTLSSSALVVSGDAPVSQGEKALPTWTTALVVAMTGPLLYLGGFGLLWLMEEGSGTILFVSPYSWVYDAGAIVLLALAGFGWYRWIRRPVYPTIQSYHTHWQDDCDNRLTESDLEANCQPMSGAERAVPQHESTTPEITGGV
jgi:hypothetical protein